MGLTASKQINPFERLKEQVKALGDKYPFGDDEILRIARCLTYLRHPTIASSDEIINQSFLHNWAVYCSTLPSANFSFDPQQQQKQEVYPFVNLFQVDPNLLLQVPLVQGIPKQEEIIGTRKDLYNITTIQERQRMKIRNSMIEIEDTILPPFFSETLEETVFALLAPPSSSLSNSVDATSTSSMEYLTMQRIEKFLNGLADCSRRGSRKSLEVIYNCCILLKSKNTVATTIMYNERNMDKKKNQVSARELVDLAYRLALASLVMNLMTKQNNQEEEEEEGDDGDSNNNNEDDDSIENDTQNNNDKGNFDLAQFYPHDVNESLVQSLTVFASKYSPMGSSPHHSSSYTYMDNNSFGQGMSSKAKNTCNNHDEEEEGNGGISLEAFMTWAETNAPCISASIETFIHRIFFLDKPYPPSRMEFMFPLLKGQHSAFFKTNSSPLLFTFACMSPSLGGAWFRLYTSDEDGLSFNRLQNSLLGYSGPTLLIIKEVEGGGIFGAFTSTAWKENKDFYGNSDCFLFQLEPDVKVIRPRGRGGVNYMYCNSESRSRGYDGQAHGIGFGGTTEKPRLFIAESFDGCIASASDLTFEGGALLPTIHNSDDILESSMTSNRKYFDIESLEVWGVGGDKLVAAALDARRQQREIKAANIKKARKVDKAAFLDDLKSGLIESKAFKHREEMRGRDDCHFDDNGKKKYEYEK